jgi:hypothetical protein
MRDLGFGNCEDLEESTKGYAKEPGKAKIDE